MDGVTDSDIALRDETNDVTWWRAEDGRPMGRDWAGTWYVKYFGEWIRATKDQAIHAESQFQRKRFVTE